MTRLRIYWALVFLPVLVLGLLIHPQVASAVPGITPATPTTQSSGTTTGPSTSFDSLNGGKQNPACTGATGKAATNCEISNSPASAFPADNYGPDQNINTGVDSAQNWLPAGVDDIIGWFFGALGTLLSFLFMLLGLVFNFDLFTTGLSRISHTLGVAYAAFTIPLLTIAFMVMGGVAMTHVSKGAHGAAWGHMFSTFALMLLGAAMILNPGGMLGPIDQVGNQFASGAIGVFSGQGVSQGNSFANTTAPLWKTTIEEPWCALEFHDVSSFCMAPISPAMARQRDSTIQHIDAAAGDQADSAYAKAQAPAEIRLLHTATTNGQLFLAFPPNWDARNGKNDDWTLAHPLSQNQIPGGAELWHPRTSGGVGERIGTLVLLAIGIFFLLLLLAYVCMYLFAAAIMFVVLLLFAPFMVLTPAFGDGGRAAFINWLKKTLFMLLAKVIYSIFLGILVGISILLPSITQAFGWWIQWGIWAIFWFLAWRHRGLLPDMMTGGHHSEHGEHHEHSAALLAGGYLAGRHGGRHGGRGLLYGGRQSWRGGKAAVGAMRGRGGDDGEDGTDGMDGGGYYGGGPGGGGGGGSPNVTPRFGQKILPTWSSDAIVDSHATDIDETAIPMRASSNGHDLLDGVAFTKNPNLRPNHGDLIKDADGHVVSRKAWVDDGEIKPVILPAVHSNGNGKTNGSKPPKELPMEVLAGEPQTKEAPIQKKEAPVRQKRSRRLPARFSNGNGWIELSDEERDAMAYAVRRTKPSEAHVPPEERRMLDIDEGYES